MESGAFFDGIGQVPALPIIIRQVRCSPDSGHVAAPPRPVGQGQKQLELFSFFDADALQHSHGNEVTFAYRFLLHLERLAVDIDEMLSSGLAACASG